MTAKRFRNGLAKNDEFSDEIIDELTGKHYFDSTKDDYVFSEEIVDLLNKLNDKCEVLEIENESLEDGATKYAKLYHESLKENERLKKQIKVYEYFLDQNDLDIDWNCLCTVDECPISEDMDFDCKDCKYMKLKE